MSLGWLGEMNPFAGFLQLRDARFHVGKMTSRRSIYVVSIALIAGALLALVGVAFYAMRDPQLSDGKVLQRPIDTARDAHVPSSAHQTAAPPEIPSIVARTRLQPDQRCIAGVIVQQSKGARGETAFAQLVEHQSFVRCEQDFRLDVKKQ